MSIPLVPLTVQELFTPMPSGVGPFGNVPLVPASETWLGDMLSIAADVQLPTTSWQPGAPERTILAIEAVTFAQSDADISVMAQGGFLQSAASGSVTYVANNGTTITVLVTPDPSNPAQNPTGALGWLDLLTTGVYDVTRLEATQASGPLAIVNLKGSTVGPYSANTYRVENTGTGATYTNEDALSIPSSVIAGSGGVVAGVAVGTSSTIITTAAPHGLAAGQSVYLLVPTSSGVLGLAGAFALVTSASSTSFAVSVGSSGTWTAGGNVYLCTVAQCIADVAGIGSNAAPGSVTTAVTQNAQVFCSNLVGWSGSNWESNPALVNRTVLSLASRSPNGPGQAYVYFAESAQQLLAAEIPPYQLTNGPVVASESGNPQTGIVTTVVASSTPASTTLGAAVTPGCSQLPITAITNANPAVVTCSGPTSLAPGQSMTVTIDGVLGTGGVNGTALGTYVTADSFSIPVDTTSTGTYTGGGQVEGGDLGQIDALLQENVVPDNTTAITASALALPVVVVATVVVPAAYVLAYQLAAPVQLQAQVSAYDIGGDAPDFAVQYDDIVGALEEAGVIAVGQASYVRAVQSLSVTVGGVPVPSGGSVSFLSSQYQAILAPPQISVVGV
jgi:hypothetical protein